MKKITKKLFNPDLHKASDAIDRILKAKPNYGDIYLMYLPHGRGAGVSTFCAFKILQYLASCSIAHGHVLVLLEYATKITECMNVFLWAINFLSAGDKYKINWYSRTITHKDSGAIVYFRGFDNLPKFQREGMSSIVGPVKILFLEDADEYEENTVDHLVDANLSGGNFKNCVALFSFNTPPKYTHWINCKVRRCQNDMKNKKAMCYFLAYKADYRHVPVEWLGKCFFDHAKALEKKNPKFYKNEYLGLPTYE